MSKRGNYDDFLALSALETDDCVIWPYGKGGQRGYGQVYVPQKATTYVHREALTVRGITPIDGQRYALHGPCNTPACMNYRHLRWGTPTENNMDRHRDGTAPTGDRNPMAALTVGIVERMRVERQQTGDSYKRISERWGVSTMTAFRAITGQSWGAA